MKMDDFVSMDDDNNNIYIIFLRKRLSDIPNDRKDTLIQPLFYDHVTQK